MSAEVIKMSNSDKDRNIDNTVDQNLYDKIIPNKYKEIEILLKELQKVSIDYHLFKKMHVSNTISPNSNFNSDISISKKGKAGKHKKTKIKQTCNPKIRRPDTITNECDDKYPIKKLNKHKQSKDSELPFSVTMTELMKVKVNN